MTITLTLGQIVFIIAALIELAILCKCIYGLAVKGGSESLWFLGIIFMTLIIVTTSVLYGGIYIW